MQILLDPAGLDPQHMATVSVIVLCSRVRYFQILQNYTYCVVDTVCDWPVKAGTVPLDILILNIGTVPV